MRNNFSRNWSIFITLIQRDWKQLKSELISTLFNGSILITLFVVLFGYMLPQLGLSSEKIAPLYLGSALLMLLRLGFGIAAAHSFDLAHNQFINYQITLPVPKRWLFASYVMHFILKGTLIGLPVIVMGILILNNYFSIAHIHGGAFIIMWILSLTLYAFLALCLAFGTSTTWFLDNAWPRCLSPLVCLSCVFFTWYSIHTIAPFLSKVILCSPLTYSVEGIRATLVPVGQFIAAPICFGVLLLWNIFLAYLLSYSLKQYRDFV